MNKADLERYLEDAVFLAEAEIGPFCRLASLTARGPIVEIGAGMGSSAVLFLYNSGVLVHSIDSFEGDSEGKWVSSEERCKTNVARALQALGKPTAIERWHLHVLPSHTMSLSWVEPIELLYLDGNHQYGFVRQDFEDWIPRVQSKGLILIHDSLRNPDAPHGQFDHGWEGPTLLAKELLADSRVSFKEFFYSTTVWQKP